MNRLTALISGIALVGPGAAALAHHSWSAEYDTRATVTVEGTVTEFLRFRPHPAFAMNVMQEDGQAVQWTVEYGGGFQDAAGNVYEADYFQPGEAITVTGQPHREDSANHVRLRSVVRDADGEQFSTNRNRGGRGRRNRGR